MLSGINFGSATVLIGANNVTIKDCTFTGTASYWAIRQTTNFSGATVENCTFEGTKSPTEYNVWINSTQAITIKDNSFLNSPTDALDLSAGVVTGNYFSGAGYSPGAHADAIYVTDSAGPTTITDNFIDGTSNADSPGQPNNDIRLTAELGNLNNVTVSGNYLIGAGYTVAVGGGGATYQTSNVTVANNYIGFGQYGPYVSQHRQFRDADREHDRRLFEPRLFNPGHGRLPSGWRSNGDCGLGDQLRVSHRRRFGANDDVGQRFRRRAPLWGRWRDKFCRRFRRDNICSAVRA